jgi:hypothetical protein
VPTSLQQYLELFNQDISSFDQALALVALGSKKIPNFKKSSFGFEQIPNYYAVVISALFLSVSMILRVSCMRMIRRMGLELFLLISGAFCLGTFLADCFSCSAAGLTHPTQN